MDNPFEKRATEYILEPLALLPLVSPEPIEIFMSPQNAGLFEKLTIWIGSPGCGKTTIARVLEFDCLWALCGAASKPNKELAVLLGELGALQDGLPRLLTHRIPVTTSFRSIWELPYAPQLKDTLLRALIQSKAVLGWLRHLERVGVRLDDVDIVLRDDSAAVRTVMGADSAERFRSFAQQVELSVFKIITALIPPKEEDFSHDLLNSKYDIFEELRGIRVNRWPGENGASSTLKPMIVIDDAHDLHVKQFSHLQDWLKSRVLGVSRWIMCRADVVDPDTYREAIRVDASEAESPLPGTTIGRDYYVKLMQVSPRNARRFRKVAIDIADRYFARLPALASKRIRKLDDALAQSPPRLADGIVEQLKASVERTAKINHLGAARLASLAKRLPENLGKDETWAALRILVHREINNSPQLSLIADEPDPRIELEDESKGFVRASLIDGARIQLLHEYKRPYYFGMEKLSDASNANIEQFIGLAGPLVDELLARIIRHRNPDLSPASQHQALQRRASEIMNEWDFPYYNHTRAIVDWIAKRCLEKTLLRHAPLDDGANAFGVLQREFDENLAKSERLTRALHYAFAYKALVMIPEYNCKGKLWCLLELGGVPILANGLTLSHGGFIEGKLTQLESLVEPSA